MVTKKYGLAVKSGLVKGDEWNKQILLISNLKVISTKLTVSSNRERSQKHYGKKKYGLAVTAKNVQKTDKNGRKQAKGVVFRRLFFVTKICFITFAMHRNKKNIEQISH